MKQKTFLALLGIFFCALFLGCQEEDISGSWKIESLQKDGVSQEICDIEIQVEQKNNTLFIAGDAGVNVFSGDFIVDKNGSISVNNIALTKMMGSPEEMKFEDMFVELLNGISSAHLKDSKLILENKSAKLKAEFSKVQVSTN